MAVQPYRIAVQGGACIAAPAMCLPAAVVTQKHGRITTPVDENQYLFTTLQCACDGLYQWLGKTFAHRLVPQVDEFQQGCARAAGAFVQLQQLVTPMLGIAEGFQRRGGRAQQYGNVFQLRAAHGEITGVITKALVLLEGHIVFFIDNDQPGPCQRREHGRARADDDAGAA